MQILKVILWSALCLGVGVYVGGHEFSGRTPKEHLEKQLKGTPRAFETVKEGAEDLVDEVKKKVVVDQRPSERHSENDRAAVDALIAKRSKK